MEEEEEEEEEEQRYQSNRSASYLPVRRAFRSHDIIYRASISEIHTSP